MTLPVVFTANGPSGYNLTKSLRFRSSASAYLNRTFTTPTSSTKWTWSGWLKFGYGSSYYTIFDGGSPDTRFGRDPSTNQLYVNNDTTNYIITNPVYRDYSACYHAVLAFDSSQGTASNRLRLYINSVEVTSFATDNRSSISGAIGINTATAHGIGRQPSGGSAYYEGYMTEINFIDGQQLTPSSFGSTNSLTGVWQPAKYTGTYGTNGFYLPFTNTTSTTTLGYDFSGNGNNWTTNNISLTAGTTYDSMTDVPTLTSATVANYCVWNPLDKGSTSSFTFSDGNLKSANSDGANNYMGRATVAVSSGKWYWEVLLSSGTSAWAGGIATTTTGLSYGSLSAGSAYAYSNNGNSYNGQTGTSYGSTYTAGDTVMVAYDADNGKIWFGKNGTWQASGNPATATNPAYTGISGTYAPAYLTNSSTVVCNFGQQGFTYTPPTGFVALNTYNLPTSTIVKGNTVMDATLYTGDNTSPKSITNTASFKPDFVWVKDRSSAYNHTLWDSVRGVGSTKGLSSNSTDPEGLGVALGSTAANGYVSALNSNGFQVTTGSSTNVYVNTSPDAYVAWQWQAGQGTTSSNTNGSITSTVSVNTTAGFSIVTWTGTGALATVGHGLGVAPKLIINKQRNGSTYSWNSYHASLGNTYYIALNTTSAADNSVNLWNSTSPTSSVFTVNFQAAINPTGGTMVSYCWAEIAGFSKFGSYTGNGSNDGPFVYLGFRPKWIMIKRTDAAGQNWEVLDTSRDIYNVAGNQLQPNLTAAETAGTVGDFLSNGFKIRTTGGDYNTSSGTYIYAAFAENPFKNALAR